MSDDEVERELRAAVDRLTAENASLRAKIDAMRVAAAAPPLVVVEALTGM